jgi:glycine/sarcosine N-methyltransferase
MISNDTNDFYDAIAEYYPYFYRDWQTQLDREGLGLRAIFRNRGVTCVLDASCGGGAQAIPLAQLGFEVVAVDPSGGMLRKAQEFAAEYGVEDKIQFECADFLHLKEVVNGPFDAIVSKGNALPHLLLDREIESTLRIFYDLLRPGGTLVIGMRDFGPFMEDRPRFLPGFVHQNDDNELITFDIWEWHDGPPVIATQNLYIVNGTGEQLETIKRRVTFRPLSTDEVKVVLLESGFEDITDQPNRTEQVLVARRPG